MLFFYLPHEDISAELFHTTHAYSAAAFTYQPAMKCLIGLLNNTPQAQVILVNFDHNQELIIDHATGKNNFIQIAQENIAGKTNATSTQKIQQ